MTIEELEACIKAGEHKRDAFTRYAEESGDELLKKAVHGEFHGGERIEWGGNKVIEFTIGSEKLTFDREAKTIKGPENLINEVLEANKRWAGVRDPKRNSNSYEDLVMYAEPGDIWNFYALVPLMFRIYEGKTDIKWRTVESYPPNPLYELMRELGWKVSDCN